jgi:Uma2 family endonuclease
MSIVEKNLLSLDDLLAMGSDARVEIIDGELIPMAAAGGTHHILGGNYFRILDAYVVNRGIGTVLFDGFTYLMYSASAHLKDSFVPDVSFLSSENIPPGWDLDKPHPGAPDLAIEIVSPGDDAEDVRAKVRTYLDKGTRQVWVTYPKLREVHQFIGGEPEIVNIYKGSQSIDAEAIFPGIEGLTLEAIFKLPPWALAQEQQRASLE